MYLISNPTPLADEMKTVNQLFHLGLDCFHLRKPNCSLAVFKDYLSQIDPRYLQKTVIHGHYSLIGKYNLKGLHFNGAFLENNQDEIQDLIKVCRKKGITLSRSVHNIDELVNLDHKYDYVFFSPVFKSISKPGYRPVIDLDTIAENIGQVSKTKIVALGGINETNAALALQAGFDDIAVLGAIWQASDRIKSFLGF